VPEILEGNQDHRLRPKWERTPEMFDVHGRIYSSTKEMGARVYFLFSENALYGLSDGRKTELDALTEAIAKAVKDEIESDKLNAYAIHAAKQYRTALKELRSMEFWQRRNVPADHRVEYEDNGAHKVSRYTTEDGYLKGLIRLFGDPKRFNVINVD